MSVSTTEHSIDLSSIEYRDYSEQEKQNFIKTRVGYAEQLLPVITALSRDKSALGKTNIDYSQLEAHVKDIVELQKASQWLSKRLEQVEETARHKLSIVKPESDKIVEIARALSKVNPEVANLFAGLFDFIAEPSKKGQTTQRKKGKEEQQTNDNVEQNEEVDKD